MVIVVVAVAVLDVYQVRQGGVGCGRCVEVRDCRSRGGSWSWSWSCSRATEGVACDLDRFVESEPGFSQLRLC